MPDELDVDDLFQEGALYVPWPCGEQNWILNGLLHREMGLHWFIPMGTSFGIWKVNSTVKMVLRLFILTGTGFGIVMAFGIVIMARQSFWPMGERDSGLMA